MGAITRTAKAGGGTNFNTGQTIAASEANTDFNTIYTEMSALLDDANIETATIPGAKSLRFTEVADPANPTTDDLLLYARDDGGRTRLITRDSGGTNFALGSLVQEAYTNTEATTATGAEVSLVTLTTSIPTTDGFLILLNLRKTAGAASASSIGIRLNATDVRPAFAWSSATNQIEQAIFLALVWRQTTSYLRGYIGWTVNQPSLVSGAAHAATADIPNATITSVIIRANSGNAAITMGAQNVYVYRIQALSD